MNLKDAKLGDVYKIFVDSNNLISKTPTGKTVIGTIIAVRKPEQGTVDFIMGWKKDEPRTASASARNPSENYNYVSDQSLYVYGKLLQADVEVESKVMKSGMDGMPCRRCYNFYNYAIPNQTDGTLLCWSCRNTW